jgi:putative peptidoglycan binding protein
MILGDLANFISRLVRDSIAHNTLDSRTIEVFFHKSPAWSEGDNRGIEHLDYEIVAGGVTIQSGSTDSSGRIEVPITGGQAELRLTFGGNPVATYQFSTRDDTFEAGNTIAGVQRRLRTLGYHLGHAGSNADGIDGNLGGKTDAAILDFQIDNQLQIDGVVGTNTLGKLNDIVGGSAET